MKLLVSGIGNTLLTEKGWGCMSCRHSILMGGILPDVTLLDSGTLSFTLAVPIEAADALTVVDHGDGPGCVCHQK
ncbi:MAG: hypothetical protein Q8J70_09280 [Thiobacillus sp.]|nr:hypothetical protein [Thiobacillus sp.]